MIKVSFIVAVYNVEKYLDRCIQSIQTQLYQDIEIILVNDGSTDRSLEICNSYAQKDNRIKVLNQDNQGPASARNKALHVATGEWIGFVDGDDFVDPRICTNVVEYFNENYDFIIFSYADYEKGAIHKVDHARDKIEFEKNHFGILQQATLNDIGRYKYNLRMVNPVGLWNKFYKRKFIEEHKIAFDPDILKLEDIAFNFMVYEYANRALYIPDVGYYYCYNPDSVTHRYQADIVDKLDMSNFKFEKLVKSSKESERLKAPLYERIARHMGTAVVLYLCNKNNTDSYVLRKRKFRQIRRKEPYSSALRKVSIFAFCGYKERVLTFAVKYGLFGMCEMLCKLYNILLKYKEE